ncbi:MAG: Non-hemolytic phospholipase C [Nitrospira sp.]|nr:Non-hemolytic phospholipase C [Nitrospira sp.]
MSRSPHAFIVSRRPHDDAYGLWRFDTQNPALLTEVPLAPGNSIESGCQIIPIGNYLLEWGPLITVPGLDPSYPYRLLSFDPSSPKPIAPTPVQHGIWPKSKFFWIRADFGHIGSDTGNFSSGTDLQLISCGNHILNFIPTEGRGTFHLFTFDPCSADPVIDFGSPMGAFAKIELGHQLIYINGFVLDWVPKTKQYALWSLDSQAKIPLTQPTIQQGVWDDMDGDHQLVAIGDCILDWKPSDRSYRLWRFDYKSCNPLSELLQHGTLPESFTPDTTLTCFEPNVPTDAANAQIPGTMDYMRSKVKHVVYIMLENRSFDHVCGWLYGGKDQPANVIGNAGPFQGASVEMFNDGGGRNVYLSKFRDGKIDETQQLEVFNEDPYHDNSDVLRQMFNKDRLGYEKRAKPDMGGFVMNNGNANVMETFTPEQLPVLNGLAKHFAISDEWFCSMPGGTDVNRAFSLTGSSLGQLNNFQNNAEYTYWPYSLHRPSIFKVLWTNGIRDWKIHNSVRWFDFVFTYQLFLQGQIPTLDQDTSKNISSIDEFFNDAREGTLSAFTYLEPRWIAPQGTTSYHPGGDLVPGEQHLLEIFEALQSSPCWNETLLVITFDEHGGIFDHVPPPYAENPFPNDKVDGFSFDIMGVRIPTILVSPLIPEKTVFRSSTPVPYEATSFLSTLLQWFGIPRSRWGLGNRILQAPSFEEVIRLETPRQQRVNIEPPYDSENPRDAQPAGNLPLNGLHDVMVPRLIATLTSKKMTPAETQQVTHDIMSKATNLKVLSGLLEELEDQLSKR